MKNRNKKLIAETNDSSGMLGKVILYGMLGSFFLSVLLSTVSVILSIRSYTLMKDLVKKNEELAARNEALESGVAELETSLGSINEAINDNSELFSAVISYQTDLSDILSKAVSSNRETDTGAAFSENPKSELGGVDTMNGNKTENPNDDDSDISSEETEEISGRPIAIETEKTLDRLIQTETDILMKILEAVR